MVRCLTGINSSDTYNVIPPPDAEVFERDPQWAYAKCPAENECSNGHHDCMATEDCSDKPEGFTCTCKHGYRRGEGLVTGKVL